MAIPKIIHYCWFGGKPKSRMIKKCMKSWQKFVPDFKIIEWNESNCDLSECQYVAEANEAKKWAFVSDYIRFVVLNKYGGVYLDTDVELIKNLDDELLNNDFVGFENEHSVASGLIMGVHKDNNICNEMLESYKNDKFILKGGQYNLYTVCQRMTKILVEKGLLLNDSNQIIEGLKVYSSKYFNPIGANGKGKICDESYSVHHYAASWLSPKEKLIKKLGPNLTKFFVKVKHLFIKKNG